MVFDATEVEFQITHEALNFTAEDIGQALKLFGQRLLTLLYSPQILAIRRLMTSEAGRSGPWKTCHEQGILRSQADLGEFLQNAMNTGKLKQADARIAALHLVGLLESEWTASFLFQNQIAISSEDINATVSRAVTVFMMAYGPANSNSTD